MYLSQCSTFTFKNIPDSVQNLNLYIACYLDNLGFENDLFNKYYGPVSSETIFKTSLASCKWFRFSGIKCVRAYETLSETNFNVNPLSLNFKPNLYINISQQMEKKLEGISIYKSEIANHPFPRSSDSIKALAKLRGSESGFTFAESFLVIKQTED